MRTAGRALVMAKAPVPGLAKTRLGEQIGMEAAAALAAAALLDTLAACRLAFDDCRLALTGDLSEAAGAAELRRALHGWRVFDQGDGSLGERLARAHQVVGDGSAPVVQVGMDTPQLSADQLRTAAALAVPGRGVLGPADDGGWWVLALPDAGSAAALAEVEMSTETTFTRTRLALSAAGTEVVVTDRLRDVDTVADAAAVAASAPGTRFAALWEKAVRSPAGAR